MYGVPEEFRVLRQKLAIGKLSSLSWSAGIIIIVSPLASNKGLAILTFAQGRGVTIVTPREGTLNMTDTQKSLLVPKQITRLNLLIQLAEYLMKQKKVPKETFKSSWKKNSLDISY